MGAFFAESDGDAIHGLKEIQVAWVTHHVDLGPGMNPAQRSQEGQGEDEVSKPACATDQYPGDRLRVASFELRVHGMEIPCHSGQFALAG